jgi:hypothetical protein
MKGKRNRSQHTGEFHFFTFSCYRRRGYLTTPPAMEFLEEAPERRKAGRVAQPYPA